MNNAIPKIICDFIHQHHVVSLACQANDLLWAASCFYLFDEENHRLIILSNRDTLHAQLMQLNPKITGTIAAQPEKIQEIEGIQFQASAKMLLNNEKDKAKTLYCKRHIYAEKMQSDVWEIQFTRIKHTSNRIVFAQKTEWNMMKSE